MQYRYVRHNICKRPSDEVRFEHSTFAVSYRYPIHYRPIDSCNTFDVPQVISTFLFLPVLYVSYCTSCKTSYFHVKLLPRPVKQNEMSCHINNNNNRGQQPTQPMIFSMTEAARRCFHFGMPSPQTQRTEDVTKNCLLYLPHPALTAVIRLRISSIAHRRAHPTNWATQLSMGDSCNPRRRRESATPSDTWLSAQRPDSLLLALL
jgi:hypothetical protein